MYTLKNTVKIQYSINFYLFKFYLIELIHLTK